MYCHAMEWYLLATTLTNSAMQLAGRSYYVSGDLEKIDVCLEYQILDITLTDPGDF